MKKIHFLMVLGALTLLASCGTVQDSNTSTGSSQDTSSTNVSTGNSQDTLSTNTQENMPKNDVNLSGSVILDVNHPLAGKNLNFDIEVMGIKKGSGSTLETIEKGDTISVHYVGTLEDGEQFDSSRERGQPLEFKVGSGNMIQGFDAGVQGLKKGEKKELKLTPSEAYGERDESRTQTVPKSELKDFVNAGYELKVGEKLPTMYGEFEIIEVIEE